MWVQGIGTKDKHAHIQVDRTELEILRNTIWISNVGSAIETFLLPLSDVIILT
jgi:hypothetical protein